MAKKTNKGLQPLGTKQPIAMVKPPPAKVGAQGLRPDVLTLEDILQMAGNDRAYTVVGKHGRIWRVHFEGDLVPSTVELIDGKPVIQKISRII